MRSGLRPRSPSPQPPNPALPAGINPPPQDLSQRYCIGGRAESRPTWACLLPLASESVQVPVVVAEVGLAVGDGRGRALELRAAVRVVVAPQDGACAGSDSIRGVARADEGHPPAPPSRP